MKRIVTAVATLGCVGYLPAGGTWASLIALPLADALARSPWWFAGTCSLAVCALSVPVAAVAERSFGRTDDRRIVIDEVAGCLLAFLGVDTGYVAVVIIGFALFRFFDIVKPGFRRVQQLPGGWGIVADDLLAGLLANLLLRCIRL